MVRRSCALGLRRCFLDFKFNRSRQFNAQRLALKQNHFDLDVFLEPLTLVLWQHIVVHFDLLVGFVVHEDERPLPVAGGVIEVLHRSIVDTDIIELVSGIQAVGLDRPGVEVLHLGLHIGRPLAGLDVLGVQHDVQGTLPHDGLTASDIVGFDWHRPHIVARTSASPKPNEPDTKAMLIRIHKPSKSGKQPVLICTRANGSETLAPATVGVEHDLVHYAVETELGLKQSFYALVASGWNIQDFNVPGAMKNTNLPEEAGRTEFIIGLLQMERRNGEPYADLNAELATICTQRGITPPIQVDEAALPRIRKKIDELCYQWVVTQPGSVMELEWKTQK